MSGYSQSFLEDILILLLNFYHNVISATKSLRTVKPFPNYVCFSLISVHNSTFVRCHQLPTIWTILNFIERKKRSDHNLFRDSFYHCAFIFRQRLFLYWRCLFVLFGIVRKFNVSKHNIVQCIAYDVRCGINYGRIIIL